MKMEKKIPTIERRNVHEVYIHITHTGNIAVELVAKICKYIVI